MYLLDNEEKILILFLAFSSIFVIIETTLLSTLRNLDLWMIYFVLWGFAVMVGFFFYSVKFTFKLKREKCLPTLIGSTILLVSFAVTLYFVIRFNFFARGIPNGDGSFREQSVEYEFPGQSYFCVYNDPIEGERTLISKDFLFFFPDFVSWVTMLIVVPTVAFIQRKVLNR